MPKVNKSQLSAQNEKVKRIINSNAVRQGLRIKDVVEASGISYDKYYRNIRDGMLPYISLMRIIRFLKMPEEDIKEIMTWEK